MNEDNIPKIVVTWKYIYVGKANPMLKGQLCYGLMNSRTGKRVWGRGPGPRNALVWFPPTKMEDWVPKGLRRGLMVVPGRCLRRAGPLL